MEFLEIVSNFYYLVVFVGCHDRIAKHLLKMTDPKGIYFKDRLMQSNCIKLKNGVG